MQAKTIDEKVRGCIQRHPDFTDRMVAKNSGATVAFVKSLRDTPAGGSQTALPATFVTLEEIKLKYDTAACIKRQLMLLKKGILLPEEELIRLTVGKDRHRFRVTLDNNPQLARAHRIKLRLSDDDAKDGRYYWGSEGDIIVARRVYDGAV